MSNVMPWWMFLLVGAALAIGLPDVVSFFVR